MSRAAHNDLVPFTGKDQIYIRFNHPFSTNSIELIAYHKFGALFSARKFLEAIIQEDDTSWLNAHVLKVNKDWIRIEVDPRSTHTLEEIMEHKYTKDQRDWKLDAIWASYAASIRAFHRGSHPDIGTHSRKANGLAPLTDEEAALAGVNNPKPPKGSSLTAERPTRKPKLQPSPRERSGVTLQSLCASLKIEPKEARTALRKARIEKPPSGWVWPSEQSAPDILKLVNALRKKK